MAKLKVALLAVAAVAVVSLVAGCRFYASEGYEEHRGERRVEHHPPVVRSRVIIIVDDDWVHRHGPCELYIDGRAYGRVERRMEIDVDEGEHSFEFRHKDFSPYSERFNVRGGGPSEIHPRFGEERGQGRRDETPGHERNADKPGHERNEDNPGHDRK
jgi:hypothetical protein